MTMRRAARMLPLLFLLVGGAVHAEDSPTTERPTRWDKSFRGILLTGITEAVTNSAMSMSITALAIPNAPTSRQAGSS